MQMPTVQDIISSRRKVAFISKKNKLCLRVQGNHSVNCLGKDGNRIWFYVREASDGSVELLNIASGKLVGLGANSRIKVDCQQNLHLQQMKNGTVVFTDASGKRGISVNRSGGISLAAISNPNKPTQEFRFVPCFHGDRAEAIARLQGKPQPHIKTDIVRDIANSEAGKAISGAVNGYLERWVKNFEGCLDEPFAEQDKRRVRNRPRSSLGETNGEDPPPPYKFKPLNPPQRKPPEDRENGPFDDEKKRGLGSTLALTGVAVASLFILFYLERRLFSSGGNRFFR